MKYNEYILKNRILIGNNFLIKNYKKIYIYVYRQSLFLVLLKVFSIFSFTFWLCCYFILYCLF